MAETNRSTHSLRNGSKRRLMKVGFSLLSVTLLIIVTELGIRLLGLDQPELRASFLPTQLADLDQHDDELFWSTRPNLNTSFRGFQVVTNSLGLRSPEIGPKEEHEFRILSLGESSTFGDKVEGDQTYSARLEKYLQEADSAYKYRVINAGVCAYSSFQSLKYLELRGLQLDPDLVLFYHEYNDLLPSTIRGGSWRDESALALTDRQLYQSKRHRLHATMLAYSATYRCIHYNLARRQLESLESNASNNSASRDRQGPFMTGKVATPEADSQLLLPRRVTSEERRENFSQLLSVCRKNGIQLVMIHPSYLESRRHECALTKFCQIWNVPVLDAYDSLHAEGRDPLDLFRDEVHPSPLGHDLLAKGLCAMLVEKRLVPGRRGRGRQPRGR